MTEVPSGEEMPRASNPTRAWSLFSAVSAVGTALAVALLPEFGPVQTLTAAGCALLVGALYLVLVQRDVIAERQNSPRAWTWAAISFVLFVVAIWSDQWSVLLLFCISPAVFLAFRLRTAIPMIIVVDLVPLAGWLLKYPMTPTGTAQALGITAVTMTVTIFFSSRIQQVLRESYEHRRLIEQLRERQAEIAALSAAQGASTERARIAREMHDTLAQGFASIVALGNATQAELDAAPAAARRHLELITATAAENLGESRRIIAALTPGRLAGSSLAEAIRRTVEAFAAESGVAYGLDIAGEARPLPAAVDVVLLRVAQEALTNVRRHAHASRTEVCLSFGTGDVALEVGDDGVGFPTAPAGAGTFGLAGMADRVAEVGGALTVDSTPGDGARLRVRIPVSDAGAAA